MSHAVLEHLISEWTAIDQLLRRAANISFRRFPFTLQGVMNEEIASAKAVGAAVLEAYTKVHVFISSFRDVEGFHHIRILKEMLLITIAAWTGQMCAASQQILHFQSALLCGGSIPWSPACSSSWLSFQRAIQDSWAREVPEPSEVGRDVSGGAPSQDPQNSGNKTVQLHLVITFALHFYALRRILNDVFLRLWRPSETTSLVDDALFGVVRSFVQENIVMLTDTVVMAAEYFLTDERSQHCSLLAIRGCSGERRPPTTEPEAEKSASSLCTIEGMNLDRYAPFVSVVAGLAEDCELWPLRDWTAAGVEKVCHTNGRRIAGVAFRGVQASAIIGDNALGDAWNPNKIKKALASCMEGYRRTRATVLLLCAGDQELTLTNWGSLFFSRAFQGYMTGITSLMEVSAIVSEVAVPLWLEACKSAHQLRCGEPLTTDNLSSALRFPPESEVGNGSASEVTSADSGSPPLRISSSYFSLLFLTCTLESSRQRFLPLISSRIGNHLIELLRQCDRSETCASSSSAPVLPLPSAVLEKCIYTLKMTRWCFQSEEMQRACLIVSGGDPGFTALAAVAVQATMEGIQKFFSACEKRAAATLAHALDYHIQGIASEPPSLLRGTPEHAHIEAVYTLLDLATLLEDTKHFAQLYADLIAPRLLTAHVVSALEVDNWVTALLECRLGPIEASPCSLLMRDMVEALQDQRASCARPTDSLELSTSEDNPHREPSTRTQRLPLGSLDTIPAARSNYLLRRLHVLRCSRWKPCVTILHTSKTIQKMFENGGWLTEEFVDAVLRAEWTYDRNSEKSYQGYRSFVVKDHLGRLFNNSNTRYPEGEDDGRSSIARISQSTSSMVVGFSSALSNAVQQATQNRLSAFTSTGALGNDDYDEDAAFNGAYGGVLRQEVSSSRSPESVSMSSLHRNNSGHSLVNSNTSETSLNMEEKRCIKWSLGTGQLTFVVKEKRGVSEGPSGRKEGKRAHASVTVVGPPVCLIILQLLNQATPSTPFSFNRIISHLPILVAKEVVGQILKTFLKSGLVERVLQNQAYAYFIAPHLSSVLVKSIHVHVQFTNLDSMAGYTTSNHPSDATALAPREPLLGAAPPSWHSSVPVETAKQRRRVEVTIMTLLKRHLRMSHDYLYAEVSKVCREAFILTRSLFKSCIAPLLEKEYIFREAENVYTVEQP